MFVPLIVRGGDLESEEEKASDNLFYLKSILKRMAWTLAPTVGTQLRSGILTRLVEQRSRPQQMLAEWQSCGLAWHSVPQAARNESLRHATGQGLLWLDADEWFDDAKLIRCSHLYNSRLALVSDVPERKSSDGG